MNREMKLISGDDYAGRGLLLAALALLAVGVIMVPSALDNVSAEGPWYARAAARHCHESRSRAAACRMSCAMRGSQV